MPQVKLTFTVNPVNANGDIQKDVDFGMVMDKSFDNIPLKGNKNYSIYNDIVIDIRNKRQKNTSYVEIEKSDLETLKNILIAATENTPQLNRRVSFMCQVIDESISNDVIEKNKK